MHCHAHRQQGRRYRTLIGGVCKFIYSCFARQIYFQIEYMNTHARSSINQGTFYMMEKHTHDYEATIFCIKQDNNMDNEVYQLYLHLFGI